MEIRMSYNLEQFKDGLKELQIELNEKQISQFLKYYELLVETNKVMNLTAITEFHNHQRYLPHSSRSELVFSLLRFL